MTESCRCFGKNSFRNLFFGQKLILEPEGRRHNFLVSLEAMWSKTFIRRLDLTKYHVFS